MTRNFHAYIELTLFDAQDKIAFEITKNLGRNEFYIITKIIIIN